MVDPFYGGAAHSSSYPPTHCMMASFPSSGDCPSSLWDATGNYFQLPLPAVAQGSSDMEFCISGATQVQLAVNILLNTNSPVCACCNKFKCQSSTNQLYPIWVNKQSESFQLRRLFHSRTMVVQSFEFDQTSHRLHSIIHKNVLGSIIGNCQGS